MSTTNTVTTLWAKIISYGGAGLISLSLYLSPIYPLMAIIGAMILADTITGRWAAKSNARKEGKDTRIEVSSKKTRDGLIPKVLGYTCTVLIVYTFDRFMLTDLMTHFFPAFPVEYSVTKSAGLILMWIEFDSIDENYYKVKGVRIKDIIAEKVKKFKTLFNSFKSIKEEITKK